MEVKMSQENLTYLEFPEYEVDAPGIKRLHADIKKRIAAKLPTITYAERREGPLHIELVLPERHEDHIPVQNEQGQVNDILLPTNEAGEHIDPFPVIVYVQGSAWLKQNLGFRIPLLSRFVQEGYAMAFIEYRSCEAAPFPAQIQDVKTAVRFLKKHAAEYNLDIDRMVLWGDSSGGHTVVMAAVTKGLPEFDTAADGEYDCYVNGVLDHDT